MKTINDIVENEFREKNILVVGDLVADQFLRGSISRVSREAPVFILRHENTETLGGGAANAASNVAALGGNAFLVGVIGNDPNGEDLTKALNQSGVDLTGVVTSNTYKTTTKLRVLAGQQYARRQQVIRVDYENDNGVDVATSTELESNAITILKKMDAVVVSDYGYGVVETGIFDKIIAAAGELDVPVLLDSRSRLGELKGATAATPNQEEVEHLLGKRYSPMACVGLREKLGVKALLVTLGNKGMFLTVDGEDPLSIPIAGKAEPVDVTGAGDTVIAAFALGVASGADYSMAARIANHAGGVVVMKKGTATLTTGELLESILKHEPALNEIGVQKAT